jgi:hypothetical protein
VDGVGREAVKDEAVQMFFIAGSVLIFLRAGDADPRLSAYGCP